MNTPPLLSKVQDGSHVPPPMLLSQHRASLSNLHGSALPAAPSNASAAVTPATAATTTTPTATPSYDTGASPAATPSLMTPYSERLRPTPPTIPRAIPISDDTEALNPNPMHNSSSSASTPAKHSPVGATIIPINAPIELEKFPNSPASDGNEEDDDILGEGNETVEELATFAHANTDSRRQSQTAVQNDIAWKAIQETMAATGELEVDDITPYFPHMPVVDQHVLKEAAIKPDRRGSINVKVLRPSVAQQRMSMATGEPGGAPNGDGSSSVPVISDASKEWEVSTRNASASQSFLSSNEQALMTQLPKEFNGTAKLVMPAYITGPISNVTLPSRLDLLGRRGFKLLGALNPRRVGNSVLGWSPVIITSWKNKEWKIKMQLFHLPLVFSKSMAKILLFLRFVFVALVVIGILDVSSVVNANPGRVWPIGIFLALVVMFQQSRFRRAPDGVMAFCRSMGVPEVEEYMFSYCWKVEPENVRTLAKAVWKAGVGVWIDVVKLCPGDEIRPMVRTTVRRVHKCIVFLCGEYCDSMNCCVEMMEACQAPQKLTICIIKNNIHPQIMRFIIGLKSRGTRICVGFDELMKVLDLDLQDMSDIAAFQWWRSQNISGAGVPDNLVPSNWPMDRFSVRGRWFLPEKSVDVGPVYISGDCKVTGQSLALPWLFFIAVAGVAINVYDVIDKYSNSAILHTTVDYVFLGVIAGCNCAPFLGFSYLLDRRRDCHVALRPLLASRSMGKEGIQVRVVGSPKDPIFIALRQFLTTIGHLAPDIITDAHGNVQQSVRNLNRREPRCVTVYIMEDLARRNSLFGSGFRKNGMFDNRFSLFIWSGSNEKANVMPFTDDEVGQRLMRFLVLVCDWEKHGLCESLFSAIGVRVVDILHEKPSAPGSSAGSIFNTGGRNTQQNSGIGSSLNLHSYQPRFTPPTLPPSLQFSGNGGVASAGDSVFDVSEEGSEAVQINRHRNKNSIKRGEGVSPFMPSSPVSGDSGMQLAHSP